MSEEITTTRDRLRDMIHSLEYVLLFEDAEIESVLETEDVEEAQDHCLGLWIKMYDFREKNRES